MHILHVTPHLPPDQAANALLPWQLGTWALAAGDTVEYIAHPPRARGIADLAGPVTWIPRRQPRRIRALLRIDAVTSAYHIRQALRRAFTRADVRFYMADAQARLGKADEAAAGARDALAILDEKGDRAMAARFRERLGALGVALP